MDFLADSDNNLLGCQWEEYFLSARDYSANWAVHRECVAF